MEINLSMGRLPILFATVIIFQALLADWVFMKIKAISKLFFLLVYLRLYPSSVYTRITLSIIGKVMLAITQRTESPPSSRRTQFPEKMFTLVDHIQE